MDPKLQALIDAPLANPLRLNIPGGKENLPPRPRASKEQSLSPAERKARGILTAKEARERKAADDAKRLGKLFDYYAGTDIPAATVAAHMGLFKTVETGEVVEGKPVTERVLDVERAAAQLAWRRKK